MISSTSSSSPVIVVFGATGQQGGSVIRHLIASDKPYQIKAVTRDPGSAASKSLAEQGVKLVQADLGDTAQVNEAVKGADYVVGITSNFFRDGREREAADGKRLIDAMKAAGVKVFFWSGVESVLAVSGGKYTKVDMFDVKAEIYDYGVEKGLAIVDVQPAGFFQNYLPLGLSAPRKQEDGTYAFITILKPNDKMHLINPVRDYGGFVVGALEAGLTSGKVRAAGEELSPEKMAKDWSSATGKKAVVKTIPVEVFASFAGEPITQMQQSLSEFGYYGRNEIETSQRLFKGKPQSWKECCEEVDWSTVLA